jgi:hypothetical protein
MRPLFTIHAGELLVGEHIEQHFRNTNVWVPAKDSGIDLLVTDKKNTKTVSLQVKFSRDFRSSLKTEFQQPLRACGWWTFNPAKLRTSSADYWVLVLIGFAHQTTDYIIISPGELYRRLKLLHPTDPRMQSYFWVTKQDKCWETRGIRRRAQSLIAAGGFDDELRNFTSFLNNWTPVSKLNHA